MLGGTPCVDEYQYGTATDLSYYFAELAKTQRGCTAKDTLYLSVPLAGQFYLSEYEFQFENGVLNSMED